MSFAAKYRNGMLTGQWYLWGYALAFSPATYSNNSQQVMSWYGGDTKANAYIDVTARPVGIQGPDPTTMLGPKIPEMLHVSLYKTTDLGLS